MKLPTASLPVTRTAHGYVIDFRHLSTDLNIPGMAVTHGVARPVTRAATGWTPLLPGAQAWPRHAEELTEDCLKSGVLYYLNPVTALCKIGAGQLTPDGERSPCVLLTPHGNFRVTVHTDDTVLSVRHQGHTLCNFWFDSLTYREYRPLTRALRVAARHAAGRPHLTFGYRSPEIEKSRTAFPGNSTREAAAAAS